MIKKTIRPSFTRARSEANLENSFFTFIPFWSPLIFCPRSSKTDAFFATEYSKAASVARPRGQCYEPQRKLRRAGPALLLTRDCRGVELKPAQAYTAPAVSLIMFNIKVYIVVIVYFELYYVNFKALTLRHLKKYTYIHKGIDHFRVEHKYPYRKK